MQLGCRNSLRDLHARLFKIIIRMNELFSLFFFKLFRGLQLQLSGSFELTYITVTVALFF